MTNSFSYNSNRNSATGLSIKELSALIGKHAELSSDKLIIDVEILNVKRAFGRTDYLVTPLSGRGDCWVSADRVNIK